MRIEMRNPAFVQRNLVIESAGEFQDLIAAFNALRLLGRTDPVASEAFLRLYEFLRDYFPEATNG